MIPTAIIFFILGILIKYGKMYYLIAGYNTLPKEEQEKHDIEGIAHLFFVVMTSMAVVIFIGYGLDYYFENRLLQEIAFWVAILVGLPYLLIKSNSKKYRKEL